MEVGENAPKTMLCFNERISITSGALSLVLAKRFSIDQPSRYVANAMLGVSIFAVSGRNSNREFAMSFVRSLDASWSLQPGKLLGILKAGGRKQRQFSTQMIEIQQKYTMCLSLIRPPFRCISGIACG